ncbi:MAG: U32 family peptidase [Lachnospiraceae bacterium]|nr:U32 family peptidase [Lachnospiraceae bacterium]
MKKPELLMPAGNLEILKTAFNFGADAVYLGGDMYGLRAKAHNFSNEEIAEGVEFAHKLGKKVYITVNITAHNYDIEGIKKYLKELAVIAPDGFIISDPGVFMLAAELAPNVERHISTQANNVNYLDYNFWYKLGATRVVSARELSLAEIKEIRANIPEDMEIESFIHGAMCISYSGRCLLSNYLTGRDANLGECTHPCRWRYHLVEETRPGVYMPVEENERGTYIFNSRDLCMIDHIPEIVDAGINSLKVEGRMKTALYVATVARAYRNAIDSYFESPEEYAKNAALFAEEITKCTNRQFTTGFYFGKPSSDAQIYDSNDYNKDYIYLGTVLKTRYFIGDNEIPAASISDDMMKNSDIRSECELIQKNKFCKGDLIERLAPGSLEKQERRVLMIKNEAGEEMESCPHASQRIFVTVQGYIAQNDLLRVGPND